MNAFVYNDITVLTAKLFKETFTTLENI